MGRKLLDIAGKRFGRLLATNQLRIRRCGSGRERLCYCDCGKEVWVETNKLTTGHTNSCGCWLMIFKLLPNGEAARNEVRHGYQADAKRRGLEWLLTDKQFDYITAQPCFYCDLKPSNCKSVNRNGGRKNRLGSGDFIYSGIDRINNIIGYHIDNVVPCCRNCNRAKSNMTVAEFLEWINRIKNHEFQL